MAHYIDKDALVAEIESYISNYKDILSRTDRNDQVWIDFVSQVESKINVLQHLLIFLDALEAKEIDLEKELKEDWLFADKTEVDCLESMCLTEDMFVSLAKKYFQLGLKAAQNEHKSCTTDE